MTPPGVWYDGRLSRPTLPVRPGGRVAGRPRLRAGGLAAYLPPAADGLTADRPCGSVRGTEGRRGMNVTLVLLDSLRADHVGCYGHGPTLEGWTCRTPAIDE